MRATQDKHNKIRGVTLVEIMVALVMAVGVGYLGFSLMGAASDSTNKAALKAKMAEEKQILAALTTRISSSVAPATYDPRWSFIARGIDTELMTFSSPNIANASWEYLGNNAIPASSVPAVSFGAYPARGITSHDLVRYSLARDTDNQVGATIDSIVSSRCVPINEADPSNRIVGFADIEALKRPVVQGGEVQCCNLNGATGALNNCVGLDTEWPTVFHYRGEGQISVAPNNSAREVLPGVAFVLTFDENPPGYFMLKTITVENECYMIQGVSESCLKTQLPMADPDLSPLQTQFRVKFAEKSGPVNSDVGGGSFIRLGTGQIKEQ